MYENVKGEGPSFAEVSLSWIQFMELLCKLGCVIMHNIRSFQKVGRETSKSLGLPCGQRITDKWEHLTSPLCIFCVESHILCILNFPTFISGYTWWTHFRDRPEHSSMSPAPRVWPQTVMPSRDSVGDRQIKEHRAVELQDDTWVWWDS
jgi:hypothetical protein